MPSRRGFPSRARSPRRLTTWDTGPGSSGHTTIAATGKFILGVGIVLAREAKVTIVRTRGYLSVYMLAGAGAEEGLIGAFGMGIVSSDASAIGVTAMPGPVSDASWPGWFAHELFDVLQRTGTESDTFDVGTAFHAKIDSKAMRKLGESETVFAMVEVVEIGAISAKVAFDSRMLFKLT